VLACGASFQLQQVFASMFDPCTACQSCGAVGVHMWCVFSLTILLRNVAFMHSMSVRQSCCAVAVCGWQHLLLHLQRLSCELRCTSQRVVDATTPVLLPWLLQVHGLLRMRVTEQQQGCCCQDRLTAQALLLQLTQSSPGGTSWRRVLLCVDSAEDVVRCSSDASTDR
jgi:hypothetical protein